jgi:hypothetical protein
MPFNSRAYRILIASPSDVEEEREIAVRVIQEWNDLYSYTRGVVLLPLRWETHSAPEYGTRPQEVINRAIVDQCDLLVGIFWTRIGTPTGAAESGTLEEISRVAQAGKPIMLYFSKVGMDPERIDLEQLNKLNAFKSTIYPNALTDSYKSHIDFRDKFARQLELRVRDLQKADAAGGPPPLLLSIAAPDLRSLEGQLVSRSVKLLDVTNVDGLVKDNPKATERLQRAIAAYVERAATTPIVLAITNTGASGVRNLYVEMDITASPEIVITDLEPQKPGSSFFGNFVWSYLADWATDIEWRGPEVGWDPGPDLREGFKKTDVGWRLTFEWSALQPNRRRLVTPALFVQARASGSVTFSAKVYADSLPEPVVLEAKLDVVVHQSQADAKELLSLKVVAASEPANKQIEPTRPEHQEHLEDRRRRKART